MSLRRSPGGGEEVRTSTRQSHITPRSNSDGTLFVAAEETPYSTLHRLANIPKPATPLHRASSVGPPSYRSTRRTPTAHISTPGPAQRLAGSARRPNALTPHGRAAIREVEARRAGLTPGKDRRRSGRQQRETPRDDLRKLSKLLAPKTLPVVPIPQGPIARPRRFTLDDFDDGPDPVRPRLSLPLGEDDDADDSLLLPPQSAGLEDENFTVKSVELPRRATSEQPGRMSRGSFGSNRMSDHFTDLNQSSLEGAFDSSFAMGGPFNDDDDNVIGMADAIERDNAATLRDASFGRGRISLTSVRDSDIQMTLPEDDTENTFVFTVPQRDLRELRRPSDGMSKAPVGDHSETNEWDEVYHIDAHDVEPHSNKDVKDSQVENTVLNMETSTTSQPKAVKKRKLKISKHGIQYPSLPMGVVKQLATRYARTSGSSKAKVSTDTLEEIMQVTDWFFEQVSDDLGAYAKHAGRKTIDESDIVALMKRQRLTNATTTPFSLAQQFLPRELLQQLRMVPHSKFKRGQGLEQVEEMEEGERPLD